MENKICFPHNPFLICPCNKNLSKKLDANPPRSKKFCFSDLVLVFFGKNMKNFYLIACFLENEIKRQLVP